jgi:type I restriction enzyme S subunit
MTISRITNTVPSLRFPEFTGDWQPRKLGDFIIEKKLNASENVPLYSLTIEKGVTEKTERYERAFLVKNEDEAYKLVEKNDFAYNPMNLRFGALARYTGVEPVKVSKYYDIFSLDDSVDAFFIECFLKNYNSMKYYNRMAMGSLFEKTRLHFSDFVKFIFPIPSLAEQEKIASFLGAIATRLTQLRRKRELLQTYKRGVMQKIFSQQIRFKQDDGSLFPDWKEKTLGQLATRQTTKNDDQSIDRVLTNSAIHGVMNQQDYFDRDIANSENLAGYYVLEKGDYVYNPRISVNAPVGPINKNKIGVGIMSPLYTVFRFKREENTFYEQYFKTSLWHKYMCSVANYGARHDRMNITTSDFMNLPLPYPEIEEQRKIVNFITAIDKKIEAISRQIEQTEQFKKGLLQKMFV